MLAVFRASIFMYCICHNQLIDILAHRLPIKSNNSISDNFQTLCRVTIFDHRNHNPRMWSELCPAFFDIFELQGWAIFYLNRKFHRSLVYLCSHLAAVNDGDGVFEFALVL